jgi:hypothetical protein
MKSVLHDARAKHNRKAEEGRPILELPLDAQNRDTHLQHVLYRFHMLLGHHCIACYALYGACVPLEKHVHEDISCCPTKFYAAVVDIGVGIVSTRSRELIRNGTYRLDNIPKGFFEWKKPRVPTDIRLCFFCHMPVSWNHPVGPYHPTHDADNKCHCPNGPILPMMTWLAWWARRNQWALTHPVPLGDAAGIVDILEYRDWTINIAQNSNYTNGAHMLAGWAEDMMASFTGHTI